MQSAGVPTRLLLADEGYALVTLSVEYEGSLIRLQSPHLATPNALREGAASMVEVVLRMMREREVGHVLEHVRAPPPDHNDFFPQNHPGASGGGDGAGDGGPHDAFMDRARVAAETSSPSLAFKTESQSVTPSPSGKRPPPLRPSLAPPERP